MSVDQWLGNFENALASGDTAAAAELFGEESYWRDLIAFTWNIKTVEGPAGVRDLLEHTDAGARTASTRRPSRPRPTASPRRGPRSRPRWGGAAGSCG